MILAKVWHRPLSLMHMINASRSWCHVVSVLEQFIVYQVGLIPSRYFTVLGSKNKSGFKDLTVVALLIILFIAFVSSQCVY